MLLAGAGFLGLGAMGFAGLSGEVLSMANLWKGAGEEVYWGSQYGLQIPAAQHLTLPRQLTDVELTTRSWTNTDAPPFLAALYRRMERTYDENLTNRYPAMQDAIGAVLRRSDPAQAKALGDQYLNLTKGQRAAYEFSQNLIEDLLPQGPAGFPDSETFRLLPGEGVPDELVGKTMAEVNEIIGYNPRRYQGSSSDPNTWRYGLTLNIRPDVSNQQAVPGAADYFLQGADRMDFMTTLMALGEATGVQVGAWVKRADVDARDRGAIGNYTTHVELTFRKDAAGDLNYLDENFVNDAYNRDALVRMQMALDLNQRSYDLFGTGGALAGQSHASRQWADAANERAIRAAVYEAFSGKPENLDRLVRARQPGRPFRHPGPHRKRGQRLPPQPQPDRSWDTNTGALHPGDGPAARPPVEQAAGSAASPHHRRADAESHGAGGSWH